MQKYTSILSMLLCVSLSAQQPDYDRAWMAYTSGQYEQALMSIQQCIALDTTNYRHVFLKGKILENLYRYGEAIAVQQIALRLNPNSLDARAALATLYLSSGQPAVSVQYYEQLASTQPEIDRWKINWATALQAAGKPELALEQLKIVEQNDTTNWVVFKNMGDCYYRIDSLLQTFHYYYSSLKLYPQNKTLWGTLMWLLVSNDHLGGAIEVGNEALGIDSTNVDVWKFLGVAHYKMQNAQEANRALREALSLGDSTLTTYSHYGIVNYHLSNYPEAEEYLLKARQLDPKDINLMNYLASTYGHTGKPQNGLEIIDEIDKMIADIDSVGMRANVQRGYLLRLLSRYNDAAKAYITATKDFPKEPKNYYEAAVCYDLGRSKKLAIDWYSRYLEKIDPQWAAKQWTEQELKKHKFVKFVIDRIDRLRVDLFFEEERKK